MSVSTSATKRLTHNHDALYEPKNSNIQSHIADYNVHVTTSDKIKWNNMEPSFTKGSAFNKNFGTTSGTVVEGNDSRLSNSRPPLAHTHSESDITNLDKYTKSEVNTKLNQKLNLDGSLSMTGQLKTKIGPNQGISFGNSVITSITGNDSIMYKTTQLRLSDSSSWDYNSWAGLAYLSGSQKLVIGGPSSSHFSSNSNPSNINVMFDGINGVKIGNNINATEMLDVAGNVKATAFKTNSWTIKENEDGSFGFFVE